MSPHRQRVVDAREALADAAEAEDSPELRGKILALALEAAELVGEIRAREEQAPARPRRAS